MNKKKKTKTTRKLLWKRNYYSIVEFYVIEFFLMEVEGTQKKVTNELEQREVMSLYIHFTYHHRAASASVAVYIIISLFQLSAI